MSGPEVPFPPCTLGGLDDTPGKIPHGGTAASGPLSPGLFPIPGLPATPQLKDGGSFPKPPTGYSEALGRAEYRAHRVGTLLTISATGTLGYAAQVADLRQSSRLIFPQQFEFVIYTPQAIISPVTRDFSFSESFGFPENAETVVIVDADGTHAIAIEETPEALRELVANDGVQVKTGYGASLQEAFDNAVAQLPHFGPIADGILTYTMVSSGWMEGGFAPVHKYFCKVRFSDGT